MTAGYSGKTTAEKLGYKPGARVLVFGRPKTLATPLAGAGVTLVTGGKGPFAAAHLFVTERARLAVELPGLMKRIDRDGMIWVSWPKKVVPKKAAKIATDITEDTIREVCLPLGLVDVKVCAVDEVWSGLKLTIRKARR